MIGTALELKAWAAGRGLTLPNDDEVLEGALAVATARLQQLCGRSLEVVAQAEIALVGDGEGILIIPEMTEVETVTVNGSAYSADLYWTLPLNDTPKTMLQLKYGARWPADSEIVVTGTLGYRDPLPDDLMEACYLLAARTLANQQGTVEGIRRTSVLGVSVEFDEALSEARLEALVKGHRRVSI